MVGRSLHRLCTTIRHLARWSGSHTNSDTPVGMPFSSVEYSLRHLSYLLNQRNVLCLNRNHLFRSIRLRFAHSALPTQRNLPNWLVREQLMDVPFQRVVDRSVVRPAGLSRRSVLPRHRPEPGTPRQGTFVNCQLRASPQCNTPSYVLHGPMDAWGQRPHGPATRPPRVGWRCSSGRRDALRRGGVEDHHGHLRVGRPGTESLRRQSPSPGRGHGVSFFSSVPEFGHARPAARHERVVVTLVAAEPVRVARHLFHFVYLGAGPRDTEMLHEEA